MGKQLKDQPTTLLISAQQIIQMGSEQMHGFFGSVEKAYQEGKVSLSYKSRLEMNLRGKITKNNEIVDELDKEIFGRIERDFGGTTPKVMLSLVTAFENEKVEHAPKEKEPLTPKEEKKVMKLNKRSKEKRV